MPDQPLDRKLLIIRPWLSRSTIEPGVTYAHFDALPMRAAEWPPYRYGAFDLLDQDELGANRLRLHPFARRSTRAETLAKTTQQVARPSTRPLASPSANATALRHRRASRFSSTDTLATDKPIKDDKRTTKKNPPQPAVWRAKGGSSRPLR
jgi:hypothetical protein